MNNFNEGKPSISSKLMGFGVASGVSAAFNFWAMDKVSGFAGLGHFALSILSLPPVALALLAASYAFADPPIFNKKSFKQGLVAGALTLGVLSAGTAYKGDIKFSEIIHPEEDVAQFEIV